MVVGMSANHTPGPWVYIGNGDIVARSEKYCGGEKDIASVFLTANDEDEANARLIAAAPDLLEALNLGYTQTMDYIQRNHLSGSENNQWLVLARAAIAKATGEHHE